MSYNKNINIAKWKLQDQPYSLKRIKKKIKVNNNMDGTHYLINMNVNNIRKPEIKINHQDKTSNKPVKLSASDDITCWNTCQIHNTLGIWALFVITRSSTLCCPVATNLPTPKPLACKTYDFVKYKFLAVKLLNPLER